MEMPKHDERTGWERVQAGDWYIPDQSVFDEIDRAHHLMVKFEDAYRTNPGDSMSILKELFGSFAEGGFIRAPLKVDYGINIHWGKNSFANFGLVALDVAPIYVGENVAIGPNVQLLTPIHPLDVEIRTAGWESAKPIWIEDNVWIGGGAIILAGIRVGVNSVVGAGSVVTKDVPPNSVVVGNPARVIKEIK
ncbi:MAG: hypothetical protein RL289_1113 [Actinomycetota bacterium]|jgi:maltose O-acetyltransferase